MSAKASQRPNGRRKLVVGNGADPNVDMGPLITAEHRDKVAGYIAAGSSEGATVIVDGREADGRSGSSVSALDHPLRI